MRYMDKSIEEIHEALISGKVTSDQLVKEALERSHKVQSECNAFVTIMDDAKPVKVIDHLLSGIPYGIKDNYSTRGILSTGSSNTLKDYIPFFTATAIENLENVGAVAVNKTVLDEFGMGGTGTTGHTGIKLVCVPGLQLVVQRLLQLVFILMQLALIQVILFVNQRHIVVLLDISQLME